MSFFFLFGETVGEKSVRVTQANLQIPFVAAYRLTAETGAFSLTGNAAGLRKHDYRLLAWTVGGFTWNGSAATLSRTNAYRVTAALGGFTWNGNSAGLTKASANRLTAEVGAFALAGPAVGLRKTAYRLISGVAAFALGGQAAALRTPDHRILSWPNQVFTWNGYAAGLTYSGGNPKVVRVTYANLQVPFVRAYTLTAAVGAFAWSGPPATLAKIMGYPVQVATGAFVWTGNDANLRRPDHRILSWPNQTFTWTGYPAGLAKGAGSAKIVRVTWAQLETQRSDQLPGAAHTLTAATGAFTLSRNSVQLRTSTGRTLVAGGGSFSLAGKTANIQAVRVYWGDIENESGYHIKWGLTSSYGTTGSVGPAVGVYLISGLANRTTYHWQVYGIDGTGTEGNGSGDQVFTVDIPPVVNDVTPFTWTGYAVTFRKGRVLVAGRGAFSETGRDATVFVTNNVAHYSFNAARGAFNVTGPDVTLAVGHQQAAESGAFDVVGGDVSMVVARHYTLTADTGAFSLSGTDAATTQTSRLTAEAGAFTWTKFSATLAKGRVIAANAGAFTLGGNVVALRTPIHVLPAGTGEFALHSSAIILRWSGEPSHRKDAGAPGPSGKPRRPKPRKVIFEDEPLTEKEVIAVVQRVERQRPKLEPKLERIARQVRARYEFPVYQGIPVLDLMAADYTAQRRIEEVIVLQKIAAMMAEQRRREQDEADVEAILLAG